jgi:hypothetical protein
MTRRAPLLLAALLSLLTSSLLAVPAAGAREVGFTTIAWGRSNWRAMDDCRAVPDTRTLEQDAQDLDARGLFGVGGVVAGRTEETTRPCINGITRQASWADLARLRDVYRWRFVSQGATYADMTALDSDAARRAEAGGSLPELYNHGHGAAWGAWDCTSPDWRDRWTSQVELSCRNSALEAIDRRGPSVVTHPAAVAAAWGVR